MKLSIGIVGLPNVGKSTLFNALLKKQQALAANYPFATIEPNIGVVPVPDERLDKLAEVEKQEHKMDKLPPKVPATVKFVDIAGLVKGAATGAGLGNKFLSHIREVSAIAHVVRAFEDEDVPRYEEARPLTPERSDGERGSVDPKTDYEIIKTELILADLQTLENSKRKTQNPQPITQKLIDALNKGIPARDIELSDDEQKFADQLFLLSAKEEIIVLNVSENEYTEEKIPEFIKKYSEILEVPQEKFTVISAKIESELSALSEEEQKEYLKELGLSQSGLERLIKKAYETLGLISFLTAGEKEVRAWTITKGMTAPQAAGVIHTDFEKHFIKADIVPFSQFVETNGWIKARELGKIQIVGRDYEMKDGDVVEFKVGV
ncbi:MAG: redox-regulated ATPase YchF [Candidatus Roizmanbacteria bacterium]|nr:MAG: redox-regulated ATPase YchF [Candidatus Roizmanbacteria bacterium]